MQILMRLRQIIQEMSRHSKQLQEKYKITLPQLICLNEIAEHGPIAIGTLTQIVFINNSTVTGIIDRLERRNLVQRVRISKDRRQVHVEITRDGQEFLEKRAHPHPSPVHRKTGKNGTTRRFQGSCGGLNCWLTCWDRPNRFPFQARRYVSSNHMTT